MTPFCISLYVAYSLLQKFKISSNQLLMILCFPPVVIVFYFKSKCCHNYVPSQDEMLLSENILSVINGPFRRNWEWMLIFRRLVFVVISVFVTHPVAKLYLLMLILTVCSFDHYRVQPYNSNIFNGLETLSLGLLIFLSALNIYWANGYMSDITTAPYFDIIGIVLIIFEWCALCLPIIVFIFYLFFLLCKKYFRCHKILSKQD